MAGKVLRLRKVFPDEMRDVKCKYVLKLYSCLHGLYDTCVCLCVQREKKYSGSPSIVAVSMALTEGNGPYSNPLKDEGYKRFKCTETRGGKRQKKRGRGGMERPHSTPH